MKRTRRLPDLLSPRDALRRQLRLHAAGTLQHAFRPAGLRPARWRELAPRGGCPTWLEASCFPGGPAPASPARHR